GVGLEESRDAAKHCRPVVRGVGSRRPARAAPQRLAAAAATKLLKPGEPVLGLVAGNQARIDGADRGADDPVRFDLRFVQGLIDAGLVGAERATALKHQRDLPFVRRKLRARRGLGRERRTVHDLDHLGHGSLPAFALAVVQCAVQPPSTGNATPVIEAAASLARNTVSAPISSTVAKRLLGCWARSTSRMTCSRGMPCALAWPSTWASTSGV